MEKYSRFIMLVYTVCGVMVHNSFFTFILPHGIRLGVDQFLLTHNHLRLFVHMILNVRHN